MSKIYKIWLHLEEISKDDNGAEEEYRDMDEEILPLPIATADTLEDAERIMNELHDKYYIYE